MCFVLRATHHQLREHPVQLVIARHGQRRFHGLQGKVLPQPVGDLRVLAAVEAAEDKGEASAAAAATTNALPGGHGGVGSGQAKCEGAGGVAGLLGGPVHDLLHLRARPPSETTVDEEMRRCVRKTRRRR